MSSVCPSVCPSVTFRYYDYICCWNTSKIISRPNSFVPLVENFLIGSHLKFPRVLGYQWYIIPPIINHPYFVPLQIHHRWILDSHRSPLHFGIQSVHKRLRYQHPKITTYPTYSNGYKLGTPSFLARTSSQWTRPSTIKGEVFSLFPFLPGHSTHLSDCNFLTRML